MGKENKPVCKIIKTRIIRSNTGITLEEDSLTVEGGNMKEISKEFDKRWKDDK